ncbi:phospholipase A2 inhibitor NAI-like [Hyperolius riggenbachi]|uniref:phospholipase A2 inhibitor NAI-like n=1 Tax=Hyperolius riggenbachi TaxID=752182 RepID=UPI0035A2F679
MQAVEDWVMMLLFLFSLLSTFCTTGYCLSCTTCSTSTSQECTGGSVVCPNQSQCSSTYIVITSNGTNSTNFFRSCSEPRQCNISGSSTFPGGSLQMATTCCSAANQCLPEKPLLQKYNTNITNGMECQQCLTMNSDQCTSKESMLCSGNETTCVQFATTVTVYETAALAFHGCATKSICSLDKQNFTTRTLTTAYKSICNRGDPGLHVGLAIPSLVSVLLMSLLL